MKIVLSLILVAFFGATVYGQDFSNKGKDFWLAYPGHIDGTTSRMALYISSDQNTSGTVELAGTTIPFIVTANQATVVQIYPTTYNVYNSQSDGINTGKGIHITSIKSIVVYAHVLNAARSGSTLLLPTNTLGRDYTCLAYKQVANGGTAKSQFTVVGVEDNTTVEITPTVASINNTRAAGVKFTIVLNKGDVYQFQSATDVTGSKVKSVSTGTGCKPLAVFSGSTWDYFECANGTSGDNLFTQLFPLASWGKNYITAPFATRSYDIFRIMVQDPATVVTLNGVPISAATLVNGTYYEFKSSVGNVITSDKPILVIQYMTTGACTPNASTGDPEMIILNAVEQTLNSVTVLSARQNLTPPNTNISVHYLNIITKASAASSIRVDGAAPKSSAQTISGSAYIYFQEDVTTSTGTNPTHTITGDSGFIAVAYGMGSVESYGYNAGTNVKDLYQFVSLKNQYATVDFPATCKNTPFFFSITLPYSPTSLTWDFNANPNLSPNTTVVNTLPAADTTITRDGRTLYVYKLKTTYAFSAIGTYPIKVTANNPTPDGCSGIQEINYDVEVYEQPIADFSIIHTGCLPDSVHFADATNGNGRPAVRWDWSFDDNTTDTIKNPVKLYAAAGNYNVKLRSITDIGCLAEITRPVNITPRPFAKFGVTGLQCINSTITYSDTSTIAQGTIVKWVWNFGNGNLVTAATNASQTQTYTTPGTYNVTLQVESGTGCKSTVYSKQVIIHFTPVVKFSLPIVCLPAGIAQFNDSSTIADGTASSFSYQWQFGDAGTSSVKNPVHNYTTAGPFAAQLIVTSTFGCMHDTTEQLTTVYPQAKAAFTVLPEVCLRDTTSFTDQSTGSGSSLIKWRWDFGDGSTDTTQNPKHKYLAAGTYQTRLYVVTDKGCISDTALHASIVNPLPLADFSTSSPLCETKDITITDKSAANAGTLANWFWNFGDGTTATYSNANAFIKRYDTAAIYNIQLAVKTDKGCKSDTLSKLINIHAMPVANFITPQVCLSDAFANFKDSSYIKDGTAGSFTYQWNFADPNANAANPNTSSQKNPVHTYSATGLYNVSLAVTSANGCSITTAKQFTVNGSVPKSDFTVLNNTSLCSNIAVQIQNASSVNFGSITKVEIVWDVTGAPATIATDSFPTANKIYTHAYTALQTTQTYQVKFRAYSGISCVDEKVKSITVYASPKTSFTTMPGICLDANARQITQASGGGVTGTEMFTGTGVSPSGLFTPSVAGAGTHTIHYVYTSDKGCKDSINKPITVWSSPTAVWGYTSPNCINNNINFSDSSVANYSNIIQWNWNFGDGTNASYTNKNSFVKKFTTTGSFPVTLQVKTDSGCISLLSSKTIDIHPLPKVDYSLPSVCLPDGQAKFTNLSTIPDATESSFSYLWNFGDANNTATSSQKDAVHKYSTTGPFNVQLIITSGNGCIDSTTKAFATIYPQPKADFIVSPLDSCLGGTFYFTDLSKSTTSNITNWNWNFGDGTKSALQNPLRQYTAARTFTISLSIINAQGCVSDTATKPVIVYPYPTVNAGADLFVLEGGNIVLNASAGGNNLLYRWTPATYLNNDTALRPVTTPADDITYRLTVTAQGGCKNYDEVFIKVLKSPTIPNVFSPNGDGINDVWVIQYLESYPGNTVQIFNRYGQLVLNSKGYTKPWDGTMNGSPLPVGVYYYIIDPKNGRKSYTGSVTILR